MSNNKKSSISMIYLTFFIKCVIIIYKIKGGDTMEQFWESRLILKTYGGSLAYGTNLPSSDIDYRGVCIPPIDYLLGLQHFEQHESLQPNDVVIYSLKKFVNLAMSCNPNILDILFTRPEDILFKNKFGDELLKIKNDFITKRAFKSYVGYANAQLKRMSAVDKNAAGKRLNSVNAFGFDTKNAMHLIRLLRMGKEIMQNGEINVYRNDRLDLLKIRNGERTLNDITDEANSLFYEIHTLYLKTSIPTEPDFHKINNWLIKIEKESLEWIT